MTILPDSQRTAKPSQFRIPPRSSSLRCSLALVANFSHSPLRVFRDLRTLSFFGSQLSHVLSAACTLFRKKPGVHPYVVVPSSAGILPASAPYLFRAGRMPALPKYGARWASPSPTKTASHGSRDTDHDSLPQLVAAHPPKLQRRRAISFISPAYEHQPRISFVSPTYAKMGGVYPSQKCRRADIFDFSPDILHFFCPEHRRRACPGSSPSTHFLFSLFHFRFSPPHFFLSFSSAQPNSP
jgi:hypothetical protein